MLLPEALLWLFILNAELVNVSEVTMAHPPPTEPRFLKVGGLPPSLRDTNLKLLLARLQTRRSNEALPRVGTYISPSRAIQMKSSNPSPFYQSQFQPLAALLDIG